MKKRLTTYIFLIAALGIALSSVFGVWAYRNRELTAARQTLVELLNLMDAQSYYTDAAAWSAQFAVAAPDKRLTIIAPDGSVLSDTWGGGDRQPRRPAGVPGRAGEGERGGYPALGHHPHHHAL